jgi:hypothetical protein
VNFFKISTGLSFKPAYLRCDGRDKGIIPRSGAAGGTPQEGPYDRDEMHFGLRRRPWPRPKIGEKAV